MQKNLGQNLVQFWQSSRFFSSIFPNHTTFSLITHNLNKHPRTCSMLGIKLVTVTYRKSSVLQCCFHNGCSCINWLNNNTAATRALLIKTTKNLINVVYCKSPYHLLCVYTKYFDTCALSNEAEDRHYCPFYCHCQYAVLERVNNFSWLNMTNIIWLVYLLCFLRTLKIMEVLILKFWSIGGCLF